MLGEVAEVLPGEGVVVETTGALVQGIFGVGGECFGTVITSYSIHYTKLYEIELAAPKHVIASRLSIQPESFSRILRNMQKDGLITRNNFV